MRLIFVTTSVTLGLRLELLLAPYYFGVLTIYVARKLNVFKHSIGMHLLRLVFDYVDTFDILTLLGDVLTASDLAAGEDMLQEEVCQHFPNLNRTLVLYFIVLQMSSSPILVCGRGACAYASVDSE